MMTKWQPVTDSSFKKGSTRPPGAWCGSKKEGAQPASVVAIDTLSTRRPTAAGTGGCGAFRCPSES
jgi:hypothetical protein